MIQRFRLVGLNSQILLRTILFIVTLGILQSNVFATEVAKQIDMFIEGCHLDMPIPKAKWLGLYWSGTDNTSIISNISLQTKKRPAGVDELFEFCVQATPKSNLIKNGASPVILLSGNIFKEGEVDSAKLSKFEFDELKDRTFVGEEEVPPTDENIEITLKDKKYILRQITNLDDHAEGDNHKLYLSYDGHTQTILSIRGNYEGATGLKILWAGDLDNDGKLDLILNAPEHYAEQYHLRIFLSSLAKNGDLVSQAGERGFDGI